MRDKVLRAITFAFVCLLVGALVMSQVMGNRVRDLIDANEGLERQVHDMRVRLEVTRDVCQEVIELGITTLDGRRP